MDSFSIKEWAYSASGAAEAGAAGFTVKSESTTINHFYEKLFKLRGLLNTDVARKIATEREEYMKEFVNRFSDEWEGNR